MVIEEIREFIICQLELHAGTGKGDELIAKLERGAPDAILEKLLFQAQGGNPKALTALAGIVANRERQGEDRDFQKDVLREMGLMRQQLEFLGTIAVFIMQSQGYQLAPEGGPPQGEERPPLAPSPPPPPPSGMPQGYNLYKQQVKTPPPPQSSKKEEETS